MIDTDATLRVAIVPDRSVDVGDVVADIEARLGAMPGVVLGAEVEDAELLLLVGEPSGKWDGLVARLRSDCRAAVNRSRRKD